MKGQSGPIETGGVASSVLRMLEIGPIPRGLSQMPVQVLSRLWRAYQSRIVSAIMETLKVVSSGLLQQHFPLFPPQTFKPSSQKNLTAFSDY